MIYDRSIKTAKRLIKKYGQVVIWRKEPVTTDTNQPWKSTAGTPLDTNVSIAFFRPGDSPFKELIAYMSNSDVLEGGVRGLMAAELMTDGSPLIPDASDKVIRNGIELEIESIDPLEPNGVPILFHIEFKA